MSINKQAAPVMSISAKKFFAKPSLLSTGDKNRRFKGTFESATHSSRVAK